MIFHLLPDFNSDLDRRHLTQRIFGRTARFCSKRFFCYSPADGECPCCLSTVYEHYYIL